MLWLLVCKGRSEFYDSSNKQIIAHKRKWCFFARKWNVKTGGPWVVLKNMHTKYKQNIASGNIFSVFHVPIFTNIHFKDLLLFHYINAYGGWNKFICIVEICIHEILHYRMLQSIIWFILYFQNFLFDAS